MRESTALPISVQWLVCGWIIAANCGFSILMLMRKDAVRSVFLLLVLLITINDLLVGSAVLPIHITSIHKTDWNTSHALCTLKYVVADFTMFYKEILSCALLLSLAKTLTSFSPATETLTSETGIPTHSTIFSVTIVIVSTLIGGILTLGGNIHARPLVVGNMCTTSLHGPNYYMVTVQFTLIIVRVMLWLCTLQLWSSAPPEKRNCGLLAAISLVVWLNVVMAIPSSCLQLVWAHKGNHHGYYTWVAIGYWLRMANAGITPFIWFLYPVIRKNCTFRCFPWTHARSGLTEGTRLLEQNGSSTHHD